MARILVIDDDDMLRVTLKAWLERAGHEVGEATNGRLGMEILGSEIFDLVITDILMPDQDGIETTFKLRKKFPDVKIIAISGGGRYGNLDLLEDAKIFGADVVFMKPIECSILLEAIRGLVG